jgi:adenylate kinase
MTAFTPIFQAFNYSDFPNDDLAIFAKDTYNALLALVRQTVDGFIEIGRALFNVREEILKTDKNGRKVFSKWLGSFGALEYFARNALDNYSWFKDLDATSQQLVRENVQGWKISAMRELRCLTPGQLKEAVTSGKKTAKQIKQLIARDTKSSITGSNGALYQDTDCDVELAPGVRVVIKNAKWWNGAKGEIKSIKEDKFWVLLDSERDQGSVTESLFKRSQLEPEVKTVVTMSISESSESQIPKVSAAPKKKMYTEEELQAAVAEALAKKEREEAEQREAKYNESYEAGQKSVDRDVIALEKHTQKLAKEKEQLTGQLQQVQEEIQRLQGLNAKNQQLQQRVLDLEKVIESSNQFSTELAPCSKTSEKVNPNFVLLLVVLMAEVKELKASVSTQKRELDELQAINTELQKEIILGRQSVELNDAMQEIIREFGEIGQSLGWNGWNRYGYRTADGTLHKDFDAMKSFVDDLKQEYQEVPLEVVFHN